MRRALAVLLTAFALAATGCGGGDTKKANAYVDSVNIAQAQFASSFERLSREITTSSTPAQDRKTLRSIAGALETTVADLRRIEPPAKVKKQHAELVDAMAAYDDAVAAAVRGLAGSTAAATAAEARLASDTARTSTRVTAAVAAINQRLRE